jgi:hypothetical protein
MEHNRAKAVFDAAILDGLVDQVASRDDRRGQSMSRERRRNVRASLRRNREVRALLYRLWPTLSPTELLGDLLGSRVLIRAAGRGVLSEDEVVSLHRPTPAPSSDEGWSAADVPLLDELAELLGGHERPGPDPAGEHVTLEEAARADRTWTYGHVIVDEAQEVSPMAWRMLVRRCPQRSMTVVGDWAQRSADWGASGWTAALGPAADRLRVAQLTVNYRTPQEAMALAAAVLAGIDPGAEAPAAIRSSGFSPWSLSTESEALGEVAAGVVAAEAQAVGDGRIAVVAPAALRAGVGEALARGLGERVATTAASALERPVSLLTVEEVKGLEFDSVLIVEPAAIVEASPRGTSDLYVALTRTTNRLGLLHARALPPALRPVRTLSSIDAIG